MIIIYLKHFSFKFTYLDPFFILLSKNIGDRLARKSEIILDI